MKHVVNNRSVVTVHHGGQISTMFETEVRSAKEAIADLDIFKPWYNKKVEIEKTGEEGLSDLYRITMTRLYDDHGEETPMKESFVYDIRFDSGISAVYDMSDSYESTFADYLFFLERHIGVKRAKKRYTKNASASEKERAKKSFSCDVLGIPKWVYYAESDFMNKKTPTLFSAEFAEWNSSW